MKFEISKGLRGLKVKGDGVEYTFVTKLFSYSSKLLDEQSNILATLNRASWWRKDFDLSTADTNYQLSLRFSDSKLSSKKPEICFQTKSGRTFYDGYKPVAELRTTGFWSYKISLEIHEEEHCLALLVVLCLECYFMLSG